MAKRRRQPSVKLTHASIRPRPAIRSRPHCLHRCCAAWRLRSGGCHDDGCLGCRWSRRHGWLGCGFGRLHGGIARGQRRQGRDAQPRTSAAGAGADELIIPPAAAPCPPFAKGFAGPADGSDPSADKSPASSRASATATARGRRQSRRPAAAAIQLPRPMQ